ncbi:MAG: DUF3237 domain-containing protein [Sphingorhabdus sp.]
MSIELVPLATVELKPGTPVVVGDTGAGTRLVVDIEAAVWTGERINARQVGRAAADWPLIGSGGIGKLDVRTTLQTDDGAIIYVHYNGRSVSDADGPILRTAPLFETAAPQYAWLNAVQAVAKGRIQTDGMLVYEVYEVR